MIKLLEGKPTHTDSYLESLELFDDQSVNLSSTTKTRSFSIDGHLSVGMDRLTIFSVEVEFKIPFSAISSIKFSNKSMKIKLTSNEIYTLGIK